ncbi:GNAT family N-acetyltransferase [Micromonospora sp. C51]|uniref:GNAT family N-acetyltransferase n=1 Tax=Micromonospora sp. C51 TaxID=2824879 RepID=UPI001B35EF5F|nr:GNAT family N-acetyltransferase [Micromonospora sp. C51]MBQ1047810.1 GNAT family N-acetyltransferase [Micromonospora sp. C51]
MLVLTELFTRAFHEGPVADWLVPDPVQRLIIYRAYFRMFVEDGIRWGSVERTNDRTAAALWYGASHAHGRPEDYPRRLAALAGPHAGRFEYLDRAFEDVHPEGDHDYLAFIGVDPAHQGMGLGSELLRHHHAQLDATGRAAYLVASSERSCNLYGRHGYKEVGRIRLPGGPTLWPMWRSPSAATNSDKREPTT